MLIDPALFILGNIPCDLVLELYYQHPAFINILGFCYEPILPFADVLVILKWFNGVLSYTH